MLAQKKKE